MIYPKNHFSLILDFCAHKKSALSKGWFSLNTAGNSADSSYTVPMHEVTVPFSSAAL